MIFDRCIFKMSHLTMSFSSLLSSITSSIIRHLDSSSSSSSPGIRDVAMREIRDQIIVIHKDSMKRFDLFYHMLRSNPYLGHQSYLRSWWNYYMTHKRIEIFAVFIVFVCRYYIWSYPPIVISYILWTILFPFLHLITGATMYSSLILDVIVLIITVILLPWYYLSYCIFPMNIELSVAYYRDMFGSNPDLNPPVIIDEMSDKLRNIVDNYRPLPSTSSFDYLRFVKETKTTTKPPIKKRAWNCFGFDFQLLQASKFE